METMGDRIRRLRKERGLTLMQVGEAVGVGKSTVRKWEIGMIANMKRDKIAKLADVLRVTPAELLGWDEEAPKKQPVPVDYVINTAQGQLLLETQDMTEHQLDHLLKYIKLLKEGGDPK